MGFKDLDIFPKVYEDHARQTNFSGMVTIVCGIIISFLLVSNTVTYLTTPAKQRLRVDQKRLPVNEDGFLDWDKVRRLKVSLDITFPNLPCPVIDFQVLDSFKDRQDDSYLSIKLKRFDKKGQRIRVKKDNETKIDGCGSCYGVKSGCCNTCKEVKDAFKAKGRAPPPLSTIKQCQSRVIDYDTIKDESCRVSGTVVVPPTHGTIVISTGDANNPENNPTEILNISANGFNLTHTINSLYFDNDRGDHPLDGFVRTQTEEGRFKALYFIRAIREKIGREKIYRLTVTDYDRYRAGTSGKYPGVYINYDVSPIIVRYKKDVSFMHFIVDMMAVLGGVYSLGMMLDRISIATVKKGPEGLN